MVIRCPSCFQNYESEYGMCPFCGFSPECENAEVFCLLPGTEITNRYVIGGTLGVGGFGITYRAWDKKLETIVAIKEYFPSGTVNRLPGERKVVLASAKRQKEVEYNKKRFLDEARNLARFNTHPNIVNVFDYFEANNTAYIVMEYLDGKTLSSVIHERGKPLSPDECISIALNVCEALKAIHSVDILHRDISPDNIFICRNGKVKVIDFGAARFSESQDTRLTIVVKPGFAPPEQYEHINKQGPWTDIYALGATMYYAVTGQQPLESTDRKIKDDLLPPASVNPNIPDFLSVAIMRAMAIDIPNRYLVVDELKKTLTKEVPAVSSETIKHRRKVWHRFKISVSVAGAVLLFAVVGLVWASNKMPKADLTVWYILTGDESVDDEKASALKSIADSFMDEYKTITVSLQGVSADDYLSSLNASDEYPDLFESTGLNSDSLSKAVTITGPLKKLEDSGGFTDLMIADNKQYPTGITVPIVYINTSRGNLNDFSSVQAIESACNDAGSTMVVAMDTVDIYSDLYKSVISASKVSTLENFTSGNAMAYLGSTKDYQTIQEKMPGLYGIHFPDTSSSAYAYATLWSVADKERDTERASLLFLEYLTSDLAQDYFHLQHQSGAVPVKRSKLNEYLEVQSELSMMSTYLSHPFVEE